VTEEDREGEYVLNLTHSLSSASTRSIAPLPTGNCECRSVATARETSIERSNYDRRLTETRIQVDYLSSSCSGMIKFGVFYSSTSCDNPIEMEGVGCQEVSLSSSTLFVTVGLFRISSKNRSVEVVLTLVISSRSFRLR
jgi:hypothetical protein